MTSCFQLRLAAHRLHQGCVLAWPTEAVYGLGCDPLNPQAISHLLSIKQRSPAKGLILVAAYYQQLLPYIRPLSHRFMQPVLQSWPGPYTWLLPASPKAPDWITGGSELIAVRVSDHPVTRQLCLAFGGALTSTSANLSHRLPARNALQVRLRCPGVKHIIHAATGSLKSPTPIRNAQNGHLIRP